MSLNKHYQSENVIYFRNPKYSDSIVTCNPFNCNNAFCFTVMEIFNSLPSPFDSVHVTMVKNLINLL